MVLVKLPDRIAHGFLEASGLHALNLGMVRCYQFADFHLGFTLLSPDEQTSVYVQMYRLPAGERKLEQDLEFQSNGTKWGSAPKGDALELPMFPADWTHTAAAVSPKRIVHQYRGQDWAVFIRYVGKSLKDPLFTTFNERLRYLADEWRTELADQEFVASKEPASASAATIEAPVEAIDLRVEQAALRKMILEGIERFAAAQRAPDGDVHNLPVTGVVVWFDVPNGYASVHFDVRAPFENDGDYSHQEFAAIVRENWRGFVERLDDGHKVTLTELNGKSVKISPRSKFNIAEAFGLVVLELIKTMRAEKAFAPLLLAPNAELIIEADDGVFSWPMRHEDRGQENQILR